MPSDKRAFKAIVSAACAALASATLLAPALAHGEDNIMRVFMDHARILKLDRPVSKVIVGNSKVADVTVADAKTIVLTGRNFGTTNIVLLDADGNAILDERILVTIDEANTVRVYRQTDRSVLSCAPNCEQHADTTSSDASTDSSTSNSSQTPN
jgi:Flp pilus assembly secretin CpaC